MCERTASVFLIAHEILTAKLHRIKCVGKESGRAVDTLSFAHTHTHTQRAKSLIVCSIVTRWSECCWRCSIGGGHFIVTFFFFLISLLLVAFEQFGVDTLTRLLTSFTQDRVTVRPFAALTLF